MCVVILNDDPRPKGGLSEVRVGGPLVGRGSSQPRAGGDRPTGLFTVQTAAKSIIGRRLHRCGALRAAGIYGY